MKQPLTDKQQEVLTFIETYIGEYGYSPSVRDIANGVRLKSVSTAHGYLKRLEKAGVLKREPERPRTIKVI